MNECRDGNKTARVRLHCLEAPAALYVSMTWGCAQEAPVLIQAFMDAVPLNFGMSDLFESSEKQKRSRQSSGKGFWSKIAGLRSSKRRGLEPIYCLRGMVCYYGKHFVSIFQADTDDQGAAQFLLFDDSRVRIIGNWVNVKSEAVKAHYQPVLLLFELKTVDEQAEEAKAKAKAKSLSVKLGVKKGTASAETSPIRIVTPPPAAGSDALSLCATGEQAAHLLFAPPATAHAKCACRIGEARGRALRRGWGGRGG